MPNHPIIPKQPPEILFPVIAHLYRTAEPIFTKHAKERMTERSITESQIEYICTHASKLVTEPRFNEQFKEWAYKITDNNNNVHIVLILDYSRRIKIVTVMYNSKLDIDDAW